MDNVRRTQLHTGKLDGVETVKTLLFAGADPGIFERGGPEAIIYKILERGGPKSLKMAFECSFQSLSYKSFANIPQKGGAQAPWAPPLNPPLACMVNSSYAQT